MSGFAERSDSQDAIVFDIRPDTLTDGTRVTERAR
jgi:hypothetical protein